MIKLENLRNKKENLKTSKIKIKIKSSTHVKFGLVQKSGYSEPLVLRNYGKKGGPDWISLLPLSPFFFLWFLWSKN
jgi:hypothetical protein